VADTNRKEWAIDSMSSAMQAVKDKKMGSFKDLLHLYVRTYLPPYVRTYHPFRFYIYDDFTGLSIYIFI
jgi:hypothetical protein